MRVIQLLSYRDAILVPRSHLLALYTAPTNTGLKAYGKEKETKEERNVDYRNIRTESTMMI